MTLQRILTAAVLIPLVVVADFYGPTWLIAILVALVGALALREFFTLGAQASLRGYAGWSIFASLLLFAAQYVDTGRRVTLLSSDFYRVVPGFSPGPYFTDLVLVLFALGVVVLTLASHAAETEYFSAVAISAASMIFVALPLSFLIRIHGISEFGPMLLFYVLVVIWVGDTCAYFVGREFGRHPMAQRLSPKKTWEGAVANLAGSVLVALVAAHWRNLWNLEYGGLASAHLIAMGVLANVAGQLGDLAESAYKRSAGAKDSSSLLPGHGGILDRIDSLIFAAPVVWYYFSVIVQRHP